MRALARKGARVVILCRSVEKGEAAVADVLDGSCCGACCGVAEPDVSFIVCDLASSVSVLVGGDRCVWP